MINRFFYSLSTGITKKLSGATIFFIMATFTLASSLFLSCNKAKKLTAPEIKYKEPIVFEFDISTYYMNDESLKEYINFCKDIWNDELKDHEKIKENTWKKGDYLVFINLHNYTSGLDDNFELQFFTSTKPVGNEKRVYPPIFTGQKRQYLFMPS